MIPGAIIDGRFTVVREAGAGGMGTVFRAVDGLDGSPVAIKLLRGDDAVDVERFEREAAIVAELRHPAIVRYVAHGCTAAGEHYLVMEWLEGEDLAARLSRRCLSAVEGVALLGRAAEALAFAHARHMVHRDIKPSNLFLPGGDVARLKLVDFGIARFAGDTRRLTRTGVLLGTPGYMAPEQVNDPSTHDPRADVFSLGCVFFECLTGRPAFEGAHPMAVLAKILFQQAPSLLSVWKNAPPELDRLVARMLAKEPAARPRDAAEVAAEVALLGELGGAWEAPRLPSLAAALTEHSGAPTVVASPSGPPSAGGPLASLTRWEQRVVSVVLAGDPDAGGFGGLTEAPELQEVVGRHGGRVDRLARGSLVVTMWTTGSAIDRAVRAARCALALRARFAGLAISVVTGRGLVDARLVEGEVFDRGARSLRDTRPGEVRLDDTTAGMLGRRFLVSCEGSTILLRGESAGPEPALLLGKRTPYVGRSRELSVLEGLLSGCVSESIASAVLVTGPAGAGKSRLCREFVGRVERHAERIELLLGVGEPLGEGAPFGLIADAIRRAAGIHGGAPAEVRRQKLAERLGRHLGGSKLPRVATFLGELIHAPLPENDDPALRAARESPLLMGDAMRAAWEEWIAAECAAHPVLLVLEDLHWGDAATIRLVDSTLRNLHDLPLMVLVLARPEVHAQFPALWAARDVQTIKLGPLSLKASETIVHEALGARASAPVVARVVEHAGGNPLYLEELIRAIAAGRDDVLPDSVLGTVEARLDAEGSEAKRVLRAASVFGRRFSRGGVAVLLGGAGLAGEVGEWLAVLAEREIITPASAPDPGGDTHYVFGHSLVREAAYATLTGADRELGHRLAGEWLEQANQGNAAVIAEHFRRGAEPARAAHWFRRAAEHALEANDLAAAIEQAGRGAECGASGPHLGALRLIQAEAELWRGELATAESLGHEAAALLPKGSAAWFRAVAQAVIAAAKLGDYDRVEAWVGPLRTAADPSARSARLICLSECATQLICGGRCAAADALAEEIDREAKDPSTLDPQVAARLYQMRSFRASAARDPSGCLGGLEAALAAFERAGDQRNASAIRGNLGFIRAELGDFEGAEEALRSALDAAYRMGLNDVATSILSNLGHVLAYRGLLDEARLLELRAAAGFRQQGDPRMESAAHAYLAKIALLSGDLEAAEREALAVVTAPRTTPTFRILALAVLARALLSQGRPVEALARAREAHEALEALGAIEEGEALIRVVYAEALAAAGDDEGAAAAVIAARERLLASAARINDPVLRERYLGRVPDNARTLALAGGA